MARGARQVVVLGAGLDTFSLRNPYSDVRVFEVDFPATQAWKRERLRESGLAIPDTLTFAPVDFERESLADGLARAGFRRDRPAFFQWLGVTPYLTRETISSTLDFIAGIPASAVAFDYTEPFENQSPERRASLTAMAESAAARGEPWLSFFDPPELAAILRDKGFQRHRRPRLCRCHQTLLARTGEGSSTRGRPCHPRVPLGAGNGLLRYRDPFKP